MKKSSQIGKIKRLNKEIYLSLISACLKRKYPIIDFKFTVKKYMGGKSLRISWINGPEKEELKNIQKIFNGSVLDSNGIIKRQESLISMPNGDLETVYMGFDFIILQRN